MADQQIKHSEMVEVDDKTTYCCTPAGRGDRRPGRQVPRASRAVDVLLAVDALERPAPSRRSSTNWLGRRLVAMLAFSAYASGAVELASGDASGALPYLRKSRQLWARVECPYEVARVRLLTGRALTALGDDGSARQELDAARDAFLALGARPMVDEVARLVEPARLPGGLTAREVEVLRLVASGRSNPQIAADLTSARRPSPGPLEHLQQARRRLPHRRRGVRLRARAGLKQDKCRVRTTPRPRPNLIAGHRGQAAGVGEQRGAYPRGHVLPP